MNAHTLRRWSPIKLLMYLWLPVYILLIFWCQGASTMHLTSYNHESLFLQKTTDPASLSPSSIYASTSTTKGPSSPLFPSTTKSTTAKATNSHYSDSVERQIKEDTTTTNWVTKDTSIFLLKNTTKTIGTTTITRTTGPYNQIPEQRTYFDTNSSRSNERERGGKIILSYSFDNNKNNSTNTTSSSRNITSSLINNFSEESNSEIDENEEGEEVQQMHQTEEIRLQKLWQNRLKEKRARIMAHRRVLKHLANTTTHDTERGIISDNVKHRSDFIIGNNNKSNLNYLINNNFNFKLNVNDKINLNNLTTDNVKNELLMNGAATSVPSSNRNRRDSKNHFNVQQMPQHTHHHNQLSSQQHLQIKRPRRYCSAKDPRTLSFEAPTVFEGKIKSMSSDRRTNFSVTFEIIKTYKQPPSQKLPQNVRLQFSYRNFSECDIYREKFLQRGYVRDELEQGKIYFLFVKQINLGNFSILGQPIKKTKRAVGDVLLGVSENYGEFLPFS